MAIVPSVLMDDTLPTTGLDRLLEAYGSDLPNASSLDTELQLWKHKWSSFTSPLPSSPAEALLFAKDSMFPNIHCLLRLVCTIPVTSCECERSVSTLRRLKTYMRSTMGEERLSGLALLHINYTMELNLDEIINIFTQKHPRRMILNDIVSDSSPST